MSYFFRRSLLCILSLFSILIGGDIFAAGDINNTSLTAGDEASSDTRSDESAKRSEAIEKSDFDIAAVKKLFVFSGTKDGLDFYIRKDDAIWSAHGGKPESGADLTDAQKAEKKAAEDEIKEAKKIGDAAASDHMTGKPLTAFKYVGAEKGICRYISEKGRFIVTADEKTGKIAEVMTVISTLDSKNVFLKDGGDTMLVMSDNNKKTEAEFTSPSESGGMLVYKEKDGERFAWVSPEHDRFYGIYRYGAENGSFRMIVDDKHGIFGLENKQTGYIWWSSPIDATHDKTATDILVDGLRSSSSMSYAKPEERTDGNTLRSGAASECAVKVKDISNGIRITYDYKTCGFNYPVEYTLEDDHLRACLKVSDIKENNPKNRAMEITVLGNLGAASSEEKGYFVIPDGSGAIVRFDSTEKADMKPYSQKIYGRDLSFVPLTQGAVTEQIYLPVYGIVKDDNAMLVVASKGDSNATLNVKAARQSNTDYNLCSFTFRLREKDTYYMSGGSNEQFTVFESGDIRSDDIELLYYPIAKKDADYTDIAERYRSYLLSEGNVEKKAENGYAPMYVNLYGGVQKKISVLGIPINMKRSVTTYDQAADILSELKENGVEDMVVSYKNWTNDGIKNKVDTDAKPSGTLGGKKEFRRLMDYMNENGFGFYPVSDNSVFYSGNGYFSFTDTSIRVSGSYSRIVSYDRAYGIPDGFKNNMSLLSPKCYGKIFGDLSENYPDSGLSGISLSNLTSSLYGDYGKKCISRYGSVQRLTEGYKTLSDMLKNGILADSANAYALPYVSHITNVPMNSSGFDIFDEDIPFFQLVMHGVVPYSSRAINSSADPDEMLLMAAATGSLPSYDLLHEDVSELADTEFDIYYYANSGFQTKPAAEAYKLIAPVLSKVSGEYMTDWKRENGGKQITAEYSDGSVITVDFEKKCIGLNGNFRYLPDDEEEANGGNE